MISRVFSPIKELLHNKMMEDFQDGPKSDLKYLAFISHDTTIGNLLKYLGYWNTETIYRKPM